jgi:hypothetical protein
MGGANMSNLSTMEQTRMLARTLAQNNDPKFQVHMLYHEVVLFTQLASSFMVPWNLLVYAWGNLQHELATMWGHEHTSIA